MTGYGRASAVALLASVRFDVVAVRLGSSVPIPVLATEHLQGVA